ncbi:hypothetical protein VM1G_11642 [Cytospora mali]|uniref:Uncharacterized protein n=1 Tax=Cytospora mali TaxID=578113 RepID=A0A194VZC1_CYTMA|nr:hypothetical protein VM1G_11642 [Valsa mali]
MANHRLFESTTGGALNYPTLGIPVDTILPAAESSVAGSSTYLNVDIYNDISQHSIDPAILAQFAGQECCPTGPTDVSQPTSRPPNTSDMTQFQSDKKTPALELPNPQGPILISILNSQRQFRDIISQFDDSYEFSIIHPYTLRGLDLEPVDFPPGEGRYNQTPFGPIRFQRFVRVTVKLGSPDVMIVDCLVFEEDFHPTGIGLICGSRFINNGVMNQVQVNPIPEYAAFNPQTAIMSTR